MFGDVMTTANAIDDNASNGEVQTDNFTSLQALIDNSDNIKLEKDYIALSGEKCITINYGQNKTIDLNGHTISRGLTAALNEGYVIGVYYGSLTITDSSEAGNGRITGGNNENKNGGGVYVDDGGSFTMQQHGIQ